jgi:hypothetical protein
MVSYQHRREKGRIGACVRVRVISDITCTAVTPADASNRFAQAVVVCGIRPPLCDHVFPLNQ